jgi:gliding motility associated protien GldN
MKSFVVKICFSAGLVAMIALSADAQRTGRRRGNTEPPKQDTTGTQVNNANSQPSGYNPYGNIPIVVDSTGLNTATVKKSLRPENAFDKGSLNGRTPLPYEHLRWDDALFAEKVWRELDLREKINQTFRYDAEDDNGSQMFINMLLKAVNDSTSGITAFTDERFTTPMTIPEIQQLTVGSADTVGQTDPLDPSKIIRYVVTRASFDAKTVVKLRIKEEWVFDRESSRMFVRILGICPLKTQFFPNGQERGSTPMFWVHYPDLRPLLAKFEVYNPKNMGQSRMTWEELFESRMFSSYITKSTIDNASNKTLKAIYKDPILTLLEGDNVREKIFNYEQDLWSY